MLNLFKDYFYFIVVFLGSNSILLYEEDLSILWKVFVSLPFWETCSNYEWEYVILGFACSYSAENRSLILLRGLDFVGNIMLNFFKDSGDQEQSSFPKNNNTTLKRFLLHYLLQFANGLFILDFAVVSCIRLSFHRTYRTFYSDTLCSLVN